VSLQNCELRFLKLVKFRRKASRPAVGLANRQQYDRLLQAQSRLSKVGFFQDTERQ
jgi:hypothetical protein